MYLSNRFRSRALTAVGTMAALATLAGCQNHKIIARVNDTPINDDEYQDFVSRVKSGDFQLLTQQGVQTDAGGAGLVSVVKEKLLEKLAEEKKVMPSPETVSKYQEYLTRTNPLVMQSVSSGQLTKEELPRLIRAQMIMVGVGSNNATVPEDEIKKEYDKDKTQFAYPEILGLRVAPVPTETEGIQLINQIKATGNFASAASKYAPQAGTVRYIKVDTLPPALKDALASLKEGQITPKPVQLQGPGGVNTSNIVVELVKRMPKGEASLADAHEAIRQHKLQDTQPQLLQHSQEVINDYNKSAKVEVYIDRYQEAVRQALQPPPTPMGMGGPGGPASGGPGGPTPGGPAPGGPAPGGSAPAGPGGRPPVIMRSTPGGPGGAASRPGAGTSPPSGSPASGASGGSGAAPRTNPSPR